MTQSSSQLNRKLAFALFPHKGGNLKCKLVNTLIDPKAFLISNLNNVLSSLCPNSQGFASCVSMTQEKDQSRVPAGWCSTSLYTEGFSAPDHPGSLDPCLPRAGNPLGCARQWGNEVHRLLVIISWSGMSLLLIMQISGAPRPSILCRCGPAAAPTDGECAAPLGSIYCLLLAFGEAGADSATRNCYSARCKGARTLRTLCTRETLYTAGPTALKLEIYPK